MSGLSRSPSHPIYFGDEDQPLFGWFHPAAAIVRDIGVVLCPALGREANFAHRTLRHLAEASAAAGLPALRFDYN